MNGNAARFVRLGAALLVLVTLGSVITGKAAKPAKHGIPLPTDWSHRHVIYSQPRTAKQADRLRQDPRFEQQWHRRNDVPLLDGAPATVNFDASEPRKWHRNSNAMHRDWATDLGIGGTVGAGNFAAKFSFDTETASCANDFVVFSTGPAGGGAQANIAAFNNLYSGCLTGTVPSVYWAYNTGGPIVTSPLFSRDGSQVAFVQTVGGFGLLTLMKWQPSVIATVQAPRPIFFVNPNGYHNCFAPCFTQFFIHDNQGNPLTDTTSSIFYDYTNDFMYVGGSGGWVHKFTGMFLGTPVEERDASFPVQVTNTGATTSSPVYDRITNKIFIGDSDGFLYSIDATTGVGSVIKSGRLDYGTGIQEGPILDVAGQVVYVFASSDGSSGSICGVPPLRRTQQTPGTPPTAACAAVYQLPTTFVANDIGTKVTVGNSTLSPTLPQPMYTGGFDTAYFNSEDGSGNLYVCGNTGAEAALYQIPITARALPLLSNPLVTLSSTATNPACSPATDVFNPNGTAGPAERLFVGLQSDGVAPGCLSGGCIMNLTTSQWQANTPYAVGQQVLNGSDRTIQVVTAIADAGNSGATLPIWNPVAGLTTTDGDVTWTNQGPITLVSALWNLNHPYLAGDVIHGSDGNLEAVQVLGFSNGTGEPTWNTTIGGTTTDGTVTWVNVGPGPFSALPSAGGTSGIIIDNVVGSGTQLGGSQVYFSPLSDSVNCGATPNTGCAIQASQSGLN